MTSRLSTESLKALFEQVEDYLRASYQKTGGTIDSILGVGASGNPVVAVVPEGFGETDMGLETFEVSTPFRESQWEIQREFRRREVQAALMWGEAWTFPPEEMDDALRLFVTQGVTPSEHPRRREIAFLSAHWPIGGFDLFSSWKIVRMPLGVNLSPIVNAEEVGGGKTFTLVSSWLEDLLPHPAPGA